MIDPETEKEWDFQIYNIVDYFHLCMENNPNMLDSMFTPISCVTHHTKISEIVRSNRSKFLSKKCFPTMKGYAYAQLAKMKNKNPIGKRKETVEKYGFDVRFASHVVRLLGECEMILAEKNLDLQRNNRQLIAIRNGEWTADQVQEYFTMKEKQLEELYHKSDLQWSCNEDEIKELLLNCLEHHYGSLSKCIVREDVYVNALRKIKENLDLPIIIYHQYNSKIDQKQLHQKNIFLNRRFFRLI